jgi:hypothetical protein
LGDLQREWNELASWTEEPDRLKVEACHGRHLIDDLGGCRSRRFEDPQVG